MELEKKSITKTGNMRLRVGDKREQLGITKHSGAKKPFCFNTHDAYYIFIFTQIMGGEIAAESAGPGYGRFCLWYQARSHLISECWVILNMIQDVFESGKYFCESKKFVDSNFKNKVDQLVNQTSSYAPKANQVLSTMNPNRFQTGVIWDGITHIEVVQSPGKNFLVFNFEASKEEMSQTNKGYDNSSMGRKPRSNTIHVEVDKPCGDYQNKVA